MHKQPLLILIALLLAISGLASTIAAFARLPHTGLANGAVRYVAPGGSNGGNLCQAIAAPCATIQHAVDVANVGDEIRVATGTYSDLNASASLTQVVTIRQGITIRGGYTAAFADPPDPGANPTTLNAGGQGRVIYITGTTGVVIEGLRILGGDVSGANDQGGGVYIENATVSLNQNTIFGNDGERGGGLYARQSDVILDSNTITDNSASYGGGVYLQSCDGAVTNNVFSNNHARFGGGGLRLYESDIQFDTNAVSNNTAALHGGGLYLSFSAARLEANNVSGNSVTSAGQGWGGGLHLHGSSATLHNNTISDNDAAYGGGLRLFQSNATLSGNIIRGNGATYGGGLSLESASDAALDNNVVADNNAASLGAGVYVLDSAPRFRHTTLAGNSGGDGSGLYVDNDANVDLINTIIFNHAVGVSNAKGTVNMTATLWDSNGTDVMGTVNDTGSLAGSAAFEADGYHVTAVSDALDQGVATSVSTDIDGQSRPHYGGYDLGADEWWSLAATKRASPTIVTPGQAVTYTLTFTNPTGAAMAVRLTDTLPLDVTYLGPLTYSSGSGGYAGGVVTWTGTVLTNTPTTIMWPVQVAPDVPSGTLIQNSAVVSDALGVYETAPATVVVPDRAYLPLVQQGD